MSHCEDLQALISPTPLEQFTGRFWENSSLHVKRGQPEYFASLFSTRELDGLINTSFTNNGISTVEGPQFTPARPRKPRKTTLSEFYKEFASGKSLALREMHVRWQPITQLVSAVSRQSGFAITADLIAAPAGSRNAGAFADSRSLFVLQLEGSSTWSIPHGKFKPLPDAGERITLEAGDTLYLPFANDPANTASDEVPPMIETGDGHSLHLVLTIQRVTWADLLNRAVVEASGKNIELRRALGFGSPLRPAGKAKSDAWFRELAARAFDEPNWQAALDALKREHRRRLPFLPDGHFELLRHVEAVTPETEVQRRPGIEAQVHLFDGVSELILPGYFYHGPEKLLLALDYICGTQRFKVKDIPGWYTDQERVRLVKHLLSMGVLTFTTPPSAAPAPSPRPDAP